MFWIEADEEEEALLCSPALMARRASESWIVAPPVEVRGANARSDVLTTNQYRQCAKVDAGWAVARISP